MFSRISAVLSENGESVSASLRTPPTNHSRRNVRGSVWGLGIGVRRRAPPVS